METLQDAKQVHAQKSRKNKWFLFDFARSIVLFESQRSLMNDMSYPLGTVSHQTSSSDEFLTSWGGFGDLIWTSKPGPKRDRYGKSKNDESGHLQGPPGGAPPYIGGNHVWKSHP